MSIDDDDVPELRNDTLHKSLSFPDDGGEQQFGSDALTDDDEDHGDVHGLEATASGHRMSAVDIRTDAFEEMELPAEVREQVQSAWALFLHKSESRESAGEAMLSAMFGAAPSLQNMFKTARAVIALRFMNGFIMLISSLDNTKAMKALVETMGFQHMDFPVTVEHIAVFRESLLELFAGELGPRFSSVARLGWAVILNYVGGAFIYLRVNCAERLRILASSWATANNRGQAEAGAEADEEGSSVEDEGGGGSGSMSSGEPEKAPSQKGARTSTTTSNNHHNGTGKEHQVAGGWADREGTGSGISGLGLDNTTVPTTFADMFRFNAAVMGFGTHVWMAEVLSSFGTIVTNAANPYRLQEECDVLSLRLAKYRGSINLSEYKSVMLASLRSLVPNDWNSAHEVAWSWLWDNIAHLLKTMMGQPQQMEQALERLWAQLGEQQLNCMRRELYTNFFSQAPAGQEYFKQSTTRLYYISDLVRGLTLELYKQPKKVVEDISGIGLRHVGYGIPVDLIAPFVTAWVQVAHKVTEDEEAELAFRWSLSLLARIMKRVITEGSTIVMKAINANSGKMLQKAVSCAPRGKRASWMLNVQVGTQRISPFMWALESGGLAAASAIIVDLLTIRADRDRYYYAVDALFERHPDVIQRLSIDAPSLLPTLLDGLVWRSRTTEKGMRRVNYYVKHLIVDGKGEFSKAIDWLTDGGDPKIACHPVVSLVMDLVWSGAAYRTFLAGKTWLLFCITVFVVAQSVLNRWEDVYVNPGAGGLHVLVDHNPVGIRLSIFMMRLFLYTCSMGRWVQYHVLHVYTDYRIGDLTMVWGIVKVPTYLSTWQNRVSLLLAVALMLMFTQCPVLYCLGRTDVSQIFAQRCEGSKHMILPYSIYSAIAMVLYCLLLTDVAVFSTHVSAFALVCGRVLPELKLFVIGVLFTALTFAAAISSLEQFNPDFSGVPQSMLSLLKITFGMFNGASYDRLEEYPVVLVAVFIYVLVTAVFLMNLLVAQLSCLYRVSYDDLLGYARLNRGRILVETLPRVKKSRWNAFVCSLRLSDPIEFGPGDIGIAGGIQVFEPANVNPTPVEMIRRVGGSTSTSAPWPDVGGGADEQDRFDRLEKLIEVSNKRMAKVLKDSKRRTPSSAGGSSVLTGGSDSDGTSQGAADDHSY